MYNHAIKTLSKKSVKSFSMLPKNQDRLFSMYFIFRLFEFATKPFDDLWPI